MPPIEVSYDNEKGTDSAEEPCMEAEKERGRRRERGAHPGPGGTQGRRGRDAASMVRWIEQTREEYGRNEADGNANASSK